MLRVLSLFSGIGAFEVALDEEQIEWELDHYCEIDKYACQSYNCIHGTTDKDNLKDVTNIDYSKIGHIDLVTYGFPCQDISLAGNQKGFYDEEGNLTRSGLFFNAADIIRHTKPKFAIFENVKNLTGKKFKKEFETVLSTLDELGYNTYWKVLNAKDYAIPQNRERVFGISIRKDIDHGYDFPLPVELTLRLKDMLEKQVEEKYYLSQNKINKIAISNFQREKKMIQEGDICSTLLARDYKDPKCVKVQQVGNIVNTGNWNNPQRGRIYSADGVCPILNCMQGGGLEPKIIEPKTICLNSKGGRGGIDGLQPSVQNRIYDINGISTAVTTTYMPNIAEPQDNSALESNVINPLSGGSGNIHKVIIYDDYNSNIRTDQSTIGTLTTNIGSSTPRNGQKLIEFNDNSFRIRKLTPRECWRLMGFKDKYFDRVQGVSNSQLYKQAGNSIVVDVLRAIFRELKKQYPEHFEDLWGEEL